MAGPWEDYQDQGQSTSGPWSDYQGQSTGGPWEDYAEPPTSSAGGAFTRGAAESILPAAGAFRGFAEGARLGASLPLPHPLLKGGAALGLGIAGGIAAGAGVENIQDWALNKMGFREGTGQLSEAQKQADIEQHPTARGVGSFAPGLVGLSPVGTLGQRAVGGLIGGVGSAASDYIHTGQVDPWSVAAGIGAGAAFPSVNKFGERLAGSGGRAVDGGPQKPGPAAEQQPVHPELALATQQRDTAPEGSPIRQFWDSYINDRDWEKADPGTDQEASQGPNPANKFTPKDADLANDLTTTAKGVAAENPKPPGDTGGGNPVGASMDERVAQPPTGPGRDYRKDIPASAQSDPNSRPMTEGLIKDDVMAALRPDEPSTSFRQQGVREPQPPEQAPQQPPQGQGDLSQEVQQAIWLARRRPIVAAPVPEGMNSSRDPNGPVYVNPKVPEGPMRQLGAIHETVEQMLMAKGMPYKQAHEIATQAEKQEAGRLGVPWKPYEHEWDSVLAQTERTEANPEVRAEQPPNKHVTSEEALGTPEDVIGVPENAMGKTVLPAPPEGTPPQAEETSKYDPEYVKAVADRARGIGWDKLADHVTKNPDLTETHRDVLDQAFAAADVEHAKQAKSTPKNKPINEQVEPPAEPVVKPAPDLKPAPEQGTGADSLLERLRAAEPEPGTGAVSLLKRLLKDEEGAIAIPNLKNLFSLRNPASPNAPNAVREAAKEYSNQIDKDKVLLRNEDTKHNIDIDLRLRAANATLPTPQEVAQIQKAHDERTTASLPKNLQDFYRDHVNPALNLLHHRLVELQGLKKKYNLPGADDIGDLTTKGITDWAPRRQRGEAAQSSYENPITTDRPGLNAFAESAQPRSRFAFVNKNTGDRYVYNVTDDGDVNIFQNHKLVSTLKKSMLPAKFDPTKINDTMVANGDTIQVDHARPEELNKHMLEEDGKPSQYSTHIWANTLDALSGVNRALERARMIDRFYSDPKFQSLRFDSKREAEKVLGKNYAAQTSLKPMDHYWFPRETAWALDSLNKEGVDWKNPVGIHTAQIARGLLGPFYMLGGQVHVFNELNKFMVGRGWDNFNLSSLVRNGAKAAQAISTPGHPLTTEILDAGGTPMYAHARYARLNQDIGRATGEDMSQRPWKYAPIFKMFGKDVNLRDVYSNLQHQTSKLMWWQVEHMYYTRYQELKDKGYTPEQAVRETEHFIDNYNMPTTIGKSVGLEHTPLGRAMAQGAAEPAISNFGRYNRGLYASMAEMVRKTLSPDATRQERIQGAGQAAMLAATIAGFYPALSAGYSAITGNPNSEVEPRGLAQFARAPYDLTRGTGNVGAVTRRLWTPSVPVDTGIRMWQGKDFSGKPIFDSPAHTANYLAGQAFSPIRDFERGGVRQIAESNLGLKTKSDAQVRYENKHPGALGRYDPKESIDRMIREAFR